MRPTDFELKVYEKTKEIPKGMIATYGEIAKAINCPNASRAVGNALNKNPHPVVVPCHRVVRSDLSVGGFSKGTELKAFLLMQEGVKISNSRVLDRNRTYVFK